MHVEPPRQPLSSFLDFAKHYLMMVLSILTALGLEAWIEHSHHVHAAELSRGRMDRELSEVLDDIRQCTDLDRRSLAKLKSFDGMITADLKAGLDTAQISKHILARKNDYILNSSLPSLPTTAWDVAVADQSVGWIEPGALQRYSAAYTAVRALSDLLQHDAVLPLDAPHLVNTVSDLQQDRPVDPYAFLGSLRQMEVVVSSMISFLQGNTEPIAAALGRPVPATAPAVDSAPAAGSAPSAPALSSSASATGR